MTPTTTGAPALPPVRLIELIALAVMKRQSPMRKGRSWRANRPRNQETAASEISQPLNRKPSQWALKVQKSLRDAQQREPELHHK